MHCNNFCAWVFPRVHTVYKAVLNPLPNQAWMLDDNERFSCEADFSSCQS